MDCTWDSSTSERASERCMKQICVFRYILGPSIPANVRVSLMSGHTDLAPTILSLANVTIPPDMDGKSLEKLWENTEEGTSSGTPEEPWRDVFLVEYYATTLQGVSEANGHIKDVANNTFLVLHILNHPTLGRNMVYAEFADVHNAWLPGENFQVPNHYELYDLDADPAQLHNVYLSANASYR